jgi:hypothetical protein
MLPLNRTFHFKLPDPAKPGPATAYAPSNLSEIRSPPLACALARSQLQEGGSVNLDRLGEAFVMWQKEHEAGPTWGLRDVLAQWRRRGLVVREQDTDAYRFVQSKWT